jgi:DNA replication and repair protein RecF
MIHSARLQHFRSYDDASFEFDNGVNIIVGPNASGKTNLLESLLVACSGGSWRGRDADLIQFRKKWARLDINGPQNERVVKLESSNDVTQKSITINKKPYKRLPQSQIIPTVLFEPNHLRLLNGPPELRREFIDGLRARLQPGFGALKRRYLRTLAQRNALLKTHNVDTSQLFAWNVRLSDLGGQLAQQRTELLKQLSRKAQPLYRKLAHSPKVRLSFTYRSNCDISQYSSSFLRVLQKQQKIDEARGFTSSGPHRDDILISLNDQEAGKSASRGEARSIALALKSCELTMIEVASNKKPLLLLDDVFSELDGSRRRALTDLIPGYQTFITTTDADIVVQHFIGRCTIIPLN